MSDTLVIIPAYNEARELPALLGLLKEQWPGLEVAVIDDGSFDDTAKLATRAGVTVISHINRMGYGATIQTGYKYAHRCGFKYLIQLDGDGQHDVGGVGLLLAEIQRGDCDIIMGSRFLAKSSYVPSMPRRIGIRFFRGLLWLFTGRLVSDPTTGFQAMNRRVLDVFVQDIFPSDYPDADIIILLDRLKLRIREIPVKMYANKNGTSMHSNMLGTVYYLFKMIVSMLLMKFRRL